MSEEATMMISALMEEMVQYAVAKFREGSPGVREQEKREEDGGWKQEVVSEVFHHT